ncbi:response regulator transcription factor [Pararhodonellum marinum]|uniref:response regulator transcription factor n=1 Tax=Pararhodonellum marinum TaxID=2755358 RepID=UPI00188E9F13|nr:response regulator transcription factor [Pararhodonellum marinum]
MKKRILIVEDEVMVAEEIKMSLEDLGHEVVGMVMNGDKALNALTMFNPDLALLDIHIKGSLNGIDLARLIRKNHLIPFVFLTAYSDVMTLDKAKDTLPYGYIVKPFNETDLKVSIELAIHKFQTERMETDFSQAYIKSNYGISLSEREYEILKSLREGLSYQEAADRLFISINTIKSYQKRLYQAFDVSTKAELIRKIG